jgi:hypothetical protein
MKSLLVLLLLLLLAVYAKPVAGRRKGKAKGAPEKWGAPPVDTAQVLAEMHAILDAQRDTTDRMATPGDVDGKDRAAAETLYSAVFRGLAGAAFQEHVWQRQPVFLRDEKVGKLFRGRYTQEEGIRRSIEERGLAAHKIKAGCQAPFKAVVACTVDTLSDPTKCACPWDGFSAAQKRGNLWGRVKHLLKSNTIFYDAAQEWSTELAALVAEAQKVFGVATNVNVYASGPKIPRSFHLHNDRQVRATTV